MYDHEGIRQYNDDGSHACETPGCKKVVPYDDEPYCFDHSPDSGSFMVDYSYKANTFATGKS